jgi:hypothetical protein
MDSRLHILRAENELKLAGIIFKLSDDESMQTKFFDIKDPETYYSAVIAHCYYSIFYSAKAYLLLKELRSLFLMNMTKPSSNSRNLLIQENLMLNY